ncbi:toxin-antitoxin system HicB family antitoxin [Tistrella mobilis]|uniref:toxin-antitoxin system HicB family antitoxin n=1 Tax=Tistrella mobilis TaxID=171437 RepID=UPI00355791EF
MHPRSGDLRWHGRKRPQGCFPRGRGQYLELCAAQGRKPDMPLKGSFNIRHGRGLQTGKIIR